MKLHTLKRFLITGGVSWLVLSSPAYATLKEALEALDDQDYSFAFEELNRLVNQEKNAEAGYHLGRAYSEGLGVAKDDAAAMKFFLQAAQQGSEKAALKVGDAYYTGEGFEKDYQNALKWYTVAAEKNNYLAQYNIGLMYEEGTGVSKDYIKAFESYKKSAEQGYSPAQISLGRMFLNGIGTPQDYAKALFWYKLGAEQGDMQALMDLAKLYTNKSVRGLAFNIVAAHTYFNIIAAYGTSPLKEEAATLRDELAATMRNEDVIIAQTRANKWKKKTREESLPQSAQEENVNQTADKKEKDEEKTEIQISMKTDLKDLLLAAGISRRDLNKAVRTDDFKEIEAVVKQKAEKGDEVASLALADLYVLGQGLKENPEEAVNIYKKLTAKNNSIAFFRLAPLYCEGKGVVPDLVECYKLMLLAKRYADEESQPLVSETLQMLDENLDKQIRDSGKKMADEWEEKKSEAPKKKGFGFFGVKDDDKKEKKVEKKEPPKEEKKKAVDDDDLFSGL